MGIKIGCPMLKLATGKNGRAGKHTGKLQSVLCEAWECGKDEDGKPYRFTKDPDYDQSKTADNAYVGVRNAYELGAMIRQAAEDYSDAKRAAGGRGLRSTAAIGYNAILKPPAEYVNGLSPERREKFKNDLLECFRTVTANTIRPDTINAVWQVDESGGHWHIAGPAILPTGELNADKIVNPRIYTALNKRLPAEMRKRGWPEIEECVNYDPDKAKTMNADEKEVYKRKCKAKRPASGKDSKDYKASKDKENLEFLTGLMNYCNMVTCPDGSNLGDQIRKAKEEYQALLDKRAKNDSLQPASEIVSNSTQNHQENTEKVIIKAVEPQNPTKYRNIFEGVKPSDEDLAPYRPKAAPPPVPKPANRIPEPIRNAIRAHRQGSRMVDDIKQPGQGDLQFGG